MFLQPLPILVSNRPCQQVVFPDSDTMLPNHHVAMASHGTSVVLQEHCDGMRALADDMRDLADDLRRAADGLAYNAYEPEQQAFAQRKRSAEAQGFWRATEVPHFNPVEAKRQRERASRFREHARILRQHVHQISKIVNDAADADHGAGNLKEEPTEDSDSKLLRQPPQEVHDESSPPHLGDKLVHEQSNHTVGRRPLHPQGSPTPQEIQSGRSSIVMDRETAKGLIQYTDLRDWKEQKLVRRKARRLGQHLRHRHSVQ
jgi:hypothetical protein